MQLTNDFFVDELRCKCGACSLGAQREDYDATLLERLQATRDNYNAPVVVTSGARCDYHNMSVGGKKNSAHLPLAHGPADHPQWQKVRAVDVACIGSRNRYLLLKAAYEAGFRRIGIARTFLHFDSAFGGPYEQDVIWRYD